jgi:hypothetical protein
MSSSTIESPGWVNNFGKADTPHRTQSLYRTPRTIFAKRSKNIALRQQTSTNNRDPFFAAPYNTGNRLNSALNNLESVVYDG